jgi:hypothetical protein
MGEAPWFGSAKNKKAAHLARPCDERYLSIIACAPGAAGMNVGVVVSN